MGRKVTLSAAMVLIVMLSAGLAGGQVGVGSEGGFLWWGNHEPIYIYGDDGFTIENGVMSGCGTPEDPYVIEGWRIDAPRADYGIYIDHTTKHFVIRECVIERSRIAGVYLNTVRNGSVEDLQIGLSDTAIYFLNADCNSVRSTVIVDCDYGVVMAADSEGNTISGCSFIDNGLHGYDPMHANRWCDAGVGNYWSDYCGFDCNGDGIGDIPYFPLRDACPLISPPVEWTGVTTAGLSYSGNWVAPDGSLVVTSQTPISLVAADPGSGLAQICYSIDCGPWTTYTEPIYLTGADGRRTITYFGIDNLGNAEPRETISFILDNHPPMTALEFGEPVYVDDRGTWITSRTPIMLCRLQESTYGCTQTFFRIDSGGWRAYTGPFVLHVAEGLHQISYYSRNASGVAEDLQTVIVIKDDTPPTTRGERSATSTVGVVVGPAETTEPDSTPALVGEESVEETAVVDEESQAAEVQTASEVSEPSTQTPSEVVDETPEETQTSSEAAG